MKLSYLKATLAKLGIECRPNGHFNDVLFADFPRGRLQITIRGDSVHHVVHVHEINGTTYTSKRMTTMREIANRWINRSVTLVAGDAPDHATWAALVAARLHCFPPQDPSIHFSVRAPGLFGDLRFFTEEPEAIAIFMAYATSRSDNDRGILLDYLLDHAPADVADVAQSYRAANQNST